MPILSEFIDRAIPTVFHLLAMTSITLMFPLAVRSACRSLRVGLESVQERKREGHELIWGVHIPCFTLDEGATEGGGISSSLAISCE